MRSSRNLEERTSGRFALERDNEKTYKQSGAQKGTIPERKSKLESKRGKSTEAGVEECSSAPKGRCPRRVARTHFFHNDNGNSVEVLAKVGIEHLGDAEDFFALVVNLRAKGVSDEERRHRERRRKKLTRRDLPSMYRARRREARARSEGLKGMYSL